MFPMHFSTEVRNQFKNFKNGIELYIAYWYKKNINTRQNTETLLANQI